MKQSYETFNDSRGEEVIVWDDQAEDVAEIRAAPDRLRFNGDKLLWISGSLTTEYNAFSGQPDLSAKESEKNAGPIPQGEYAIDPTKIGPPPVGEDPDAWGKRRVKSEPLKSTVQRMKDCFGGTRDGLYIHGGTSKGTIGCIEINDDSEDKAFFDRLENYGKKIQLIVKFEGEYENKLEEPRCPFV